MSHAHHSETLQEADIRDISAFDIDENRCKNKMEQYITQQYVKYVKQFIK